MIFCLMCSGSLNVRAQEFRILKGSVLDSATLSPLSGATVMVQNSNIRIKTGQNGTFEMTVPSGLIRLLVSYSEYRSWEGTVDVTLNEVSVFLVRDERLMEEVVVFNDGLSRTIANKATGSFTRLDSSQLNQVIETNVMDRLRYMANGFQVTPGTGSASGLTLIRGVGTMTRNIQKPLVILDNFEYSGDLNNINPNDVQDIVILKDAASAAIWGARAANGVIIINTRKGKYDQPVRVGFSSALTVKEKPDLHRIPSVSTSDLIDIEMMYFNYGFYESFLNLQRSSGPSELLIALRKHQRGQMSQSELDAYVAELRTRDVRKEFEKYIYRSPMLRQHAISLDGGSRQFSWRVSGGWDENVDELYGRYSRVTMSSNLQVKLSPSTEWTTRISYTESKTSMPRAGYGKVRANLGPLPMYTRFVDDEGNPQPFYLNRGPEFVDTAGKGYLLDWRYYPLTDHEHTSETWRVQNTNLALQLDQKLIKGVNLVLGYRYQREKNRMDRYYGVQSYYARDMINRMAQHDYPNNRMIFPIPVGGILEHSDGDLLSQNVRAQLLVRKSFESGNLNIMLGSELSESKSKNTVGTIFGYDPETLTSVPVNLATSYFNFADFLFSTPQGISGISDGNNRLVSVYANGSYVLHNKYSFSASMRKDASNLFGVATNHRWKPLWSAGLAWEISKEKFYSSSLFPELKIRTSYGSQGNMDPSKVAVTTMSYGATNSVTHLTPGNIRNYPNANLRWEQTNIWNLAVELGTKGNRFRLVAEYFDKDISDMYANLPVDLTAGVGNSILRNIGRMRTRGFDFQLNASLLRRDLKWDVDLVVNRARSVTTRYRDESGSSSIFTGLNLLGVEGYDAASYFAYRWGGLDPQNGDPIGLLNGVPSKDYQKLTGTGTLLRDMVYIGSAIPIWTGSFGNRLQWKGLDLSFRFMGSFRYFFKRPTYSDNLPRSREAHPDFLKRWQKPGDELHTQVPSFVYPTVNYRLQFFQDSEIMAERGDHIRLQYINLSYSPEIPKRLKKYLRSISISVVANNLGVVWKATNVPGDPQGNMMGLPPLKSFSMGINASF